MRLIFKLVDGIKQISLPREFLLPDDLQTGILAFPRLCAQTKASLLLGLESGVCWPLDVKRNIGFSGFQTFELGLKLNH